MTESGGPRRVRSGKKTLPGAVIALGVVSFFNDVASDLVVPLLPIFLATVLGAGPAALGLIEGVAEAVASLLKLWAGRHSDTIGGRRKPLVVGGYALSNLARPLFALAAGWPFLLALRSIDRIGKGIRGAPRDAMIADWTPPEQTGIAFGLQRAFDNAGAVLGSLIAAAALAFWTSSLQTVLLASAIPGALCLLLLAFGVAEPPRHRPVSQPLPPLRWRALSPLMRRYLLVLAGFTLARVSETFLVLRGYELGGSVVELLLLWSALNAAKSACAYAGGALSDRFGRRSVMLASWIAFAAGFYALCTLTSLSALWGATLFYGCFAGLSEGAERALIEDLGNKDERGTAFGWYYLMTGLAAIPAGVIFGLLWQFQSAAMAFSLAAAAAALSALLLLLWVRPAGA
ncbi:MAG: MFS transporter [Betaproteobacteria bacterium]|nr:MFS transporter [Betaproteobacteria bacterium]